MPAPQLTPDQLQQAIAAWQGSNAPPAQSAPAPTPAVAPPPVQAAPVPVDVPAPVVAPAPVPVEAPSPTVDVAPTPTPQNSRQALAQMGEQANIQAGAVQDESAAKVAANTAEADLIAQQQAEEAKAQAVEAKAHAEGIAKTKNLFDQYQEFKAQNANLQAKDSRTTTQRVMGLLGKAFGSVADGLSGFSGHQTNFAGDIEKSINDSVDKDLAKQQAAIEGKHKQAAEMLTDLGLARKFFVDDPDAAAAYAKAQRKELYANSLAELSKRSANPAIQAQGTEAAAKIKQAAAQDMAQIYASKENAIYNAGAANARAVQAVQIQPGNTPIPVLEKKVKENTATPNEIQELAAVRDAEDKHRKALIAEAQAENAKGPDGKPLTEGQAKAGALYQSSAADAERIQAAIAGNKLPGAATVRAAESPLVPDSAIPAEAETYRSARGLVNDVLRDESGASIGAAEKEELLNPLKSTDPNIRKQGYLRILAKRDAMGGKVPQNRPKGAPGKGSVPDNAGSVPSGPVMMSLDGIKFFPVAPDKVAEARKKFPKAIVKE